MRAQCCTFITACGASLLFLLGGVLFCPAGESVESPWQRLYTGREASGGTVLALWQFQPGAETKDASGNGHELTLRGESRFAPGGKFGSCLESFPAGVDNDQAQGAITANRPDLTPAGAFTLEAWLKPKPDMADSATVFILDKKYFHYANERPEANTDYCLFLRRAGEGKWSMVAYLGFGDSSAYYTSRALAFAPGQWSHLAFSYDGQGTGRFFVAGKAAGRTTHEGRGPVSAGRYGLVIGDRFGSTHHGCPAYLDQVRICSGIPPYLPALWKSYWTRRASATSGWNLTRASRVRS